MYEMTIYHSLCNHIGEKAPGNDIDIYLQPLVQGLELLWEGVNIFDAFRREFFNLKGALICTVSDFPTYSNLSGWSNKGYNACLWCGNSTHSIYLPFGRRICYIGHHRWLPNDHPFHSDADAFDGTIETRNAPPQLSGSQIMREQDKVSFKYGKTRKSSKRAKDEANTSVGGVSLGASSDDTNKVKEFEDDPEIVMEAQPTTNYEVLWKKKSIFL